jgi:glycosyltransferase involved in cell wall biosynthesis
MHPSPTISLIVTCYNHERYVEQCLDSIAAQTFTDFETVIVDDCSTDGSARRIRRWLDTHDLEARFLVNDRNLGMCAARNLGLQHCTGEYLASLSADDWYDPAKFQREVEFFQCLEDDVVAVFGNMRLVDDEGKGDTSWFPDQVPMDPPLEGDVFARLLQSNFIPAPATTARRQAVVAGGGYDESLVYEDYDIWLRLARSSQFRYLPYRTVNYRVHASNFSIDPARRISMQLSTARLLAKWFGTSDAATDEFIARRVWAIALRIYVEDPTSALPLLRDRRVRSGAVRREMVAALAGVPGFRMLVDRWLRWRLRRAGVGGRGELTDRSSEYL